MKKLLSIFVLVLSLTCCLAPAGLSESPQTIFAQTDSYMAVRQDTAYPISFYLIYQGKHPFEEKELERVSLPEENCEGIRFDGFQWLDSDLSGTYSAKSLITEMRFFQEGRYEFHSISLHFTDGSSETFPIGRFVVEVFDEPDSEALYTYATTAMCSNANTLYCCYLLEDEDISFQTLEMDLQASSEIVYAEKEVYVFEDGATQDCIRIEMHFTSELPVVYRFVLPRVHISVGGKDQAIYPKLGCYCGGTGIQPEDVIAAYEAWNP